jgi:hypothetical protein
VLRGRSGIDGIATFAVGSHYRWGQKSQNFSTIDERVSYLSTPARTAESLIECKRSASQKRAKKRTGAICNCKLFLFQADDPL